MAREQKDTVMNHLAGLPESRRERGKAIHRLVKKLFPKTTCDFSYRMPTYHVGENFFAWKSQKAYLSIYTCSAERIASFTKKHPDVPSGTGCIYFRDRNPFPLL